MHLPAIIYRKTPTVIYKYSMFIPAYIKSYKSGVLEERIEKLYKILKSCELCPRKCGVDRTKNEPGYCKSGIDLIISSSGPHFGEEKELVGRGGSGTIFLTNCNLGCIYCQNYDISHLGQGKVVSVEQCSELMLNLQGIGCHNINFVTPTHFVPQIVKSIKIACAKGLKLPIVYNCGGYENVEIIKLLEGTVDIYMPDMKYVDNKNAKKYSNAEDYFERCTESVKEMYRQVGDLRVENGIAQRGLLVRHLVLPNDIAGTEKILKFVAEEISKDTYVNIMDQYRPIYKANQFSELNRIPTINEYGRAIELAENLGLRRGYPL